MTPLLSFLNVSKSYPDGGREIPVLERISLEPTLLFQPRKHR